MMDCTAEGTRRVCCLLHDWEHLDYFKTRDSRRRWNLISSQSLLEQKCCELMSTSWTAAARQGSLSCQTTAEGRALTIQIWNNNLTDKYLFQPKSINLLLARLQLQPDLKEETRAFLTPHHPFAWLRKCVSLFPLMTSSITDKQLLIYQLCFGRHLRKWADW